MAEMSNESDLSTSEEESDRVTAPPPKKQKIYKQKYNKKLEEDPLLKTFVLGCGCYCSCNLSNGWGSLIMISSSTQTQVGQDNHEH